MRSPVDTDSTLVRGARARVRSVLLHGAERAGMRLEWLEDTATFYDDHGRSAATPQIMAQAAEIPGMISMRRGMYYYWLAYAGLPGNIIEIGCWQGRSTSFLAQACKDSGNGVVHVVDTFGGNPGNEAAYRVGRDDLSDLESNFRANMGRLGLSEQVVVHSGRSQDLADEVTAAAGPVRMLAIDGEHTYEAVKAELDLYGPALQVGGVLVHDDYSKSFEGVARAVDEHISETGWYSTPAQDRNLLVARRVR